LKSRFVFALLIGIFFISTSAWTIYEFRRNDRAVRNLSATTTADFDMLNAKLDRIMPRMVGHEHSEVREFMIASQLAQMKSPIVFLGDSITEAAVLPSSICGVAVVNAGIGGAGVDELLKAVPALLNGKSPALVVVSIGTNDAYPSSSRERQFSASYAKLLQTLKLLTPLTVVTTIPPIDPKGALTAAAGFDARLIDRFNALIPKMAEDAGASFIDLNLAVRGSGTMETLDGVHLAPAAYDRWNAAMGAGARKALRC
jgi:lysophospholipase L1-like esterase